jgi:hypothetical protein
MNAFHSRSPRQIGAVSANRLSALLAVILFFTIRGMMLP